MKMESKLLGLTAAGVLDEIDKWMVGNKEQASDLWTVLSALRGPDDDRTIGTKTYSTSLIRAWAFPRASNLLSEELGIEVNFGLTEFHTGSGEHFSSHMMGARNVLGMMGRVYTLSQEEQSVSRSIRVTDYDHLITTALGRLKI